MSTRKCFRVCCSSEIMQHYKEINILNKHSTNVSETSHSSDSQSRLQLQSVHLEAASPCNLRGTPKLELIIYYHPWVATAKDYPNTHAGEKKVIYIYIYTYMTVTQCCLRQLCSFQPQFLRVLAKLCPCP